MEIQPLTAQIDVIIDNQPLIDKITQLQQTIETLTQEKTQLEQDLASANAQIDLLNIQIQALNTQIETLQGEKLQLQQQITQLQSEVSTLQTQKANLESQVSTLTSQIETLQGQITTLQGQVSDLQTQINTLQSDLDSINGEVVQDKTGYLAETKNQIKSAIVNKGVSVASSDTFRSYATKIGQIPQGRIITDKNTLLLCPFDESPTKDISPFEYVLQTEGAPVISSTQTLFGKPTLYLDGSSGLILNDKCFQPFLGNFTLEFWWYPTEFQTNVQYSFFGQNSYQPYGSASGYREYWTFYGITSNKIEFNFWDATNSTSSSYGQSSNLVSSYYLKLNQWNHIAFVKNPENGTASEIYKTYVNGNSMYWYTSIYSSNYYYQLNNPKTIPSPLYIFYYQWYNGNKARFMKGYFSNLRISNCTRYTSNFTPPTEPFSV